MRWKREIISSAFDVSKRIIIRKGKKNRKADEQHENRNLYNISRIVERLRAPAFQSLQNASAGEKSETISMFLSAGLYWDFFFAVAGAPKRNKRAKQEIKSKNNFTAATVSGEPKQVKNAEKNSFSGSRTSFFYWFARFAAALDSVVL